MADYPRQAYRPATQADYHAQMFHSTPTAVYPRQPDANVTMQPGVPPMAAPPVLPSSIHDALNFAAPGVIEQMLSNNPQLIHEKGFNGQGILHRAVLRIEPEVTRVALAHGADPNLRNNHDETALHFAARRGNPHILHLLVEAGGDPTVTDRSGKSLMHHATHGGFVAMLHYLLTACGLSAEVLDNNQRTPLHLLCEHGHPEAFEYLVRKQRCDLTRRDGRGDSVLHVVARYGHEWLAWRILQLGGVDLLHQRNHAGATPLELARKETQSPKQKAVVSLLESYSSRSDRTTRVECPRWLWLWYLLCPAVLYGATLALCQVTSYKGIVMIVGAVAILSVMLQQMHRIRHPSRLANPMFTGMFAAGLLYTSLCYFVLVLPVVYEDSLVLTLFCVCLSLTVYYLYYRILTVDPGVQKHPRRKQDGSYYDVMDIARGDVNLEGFCKTCEIVPPVLTKHCKLCNECLSQMDHHCLFLYRCIAFNNHRLFIQLILAVLVAMVMTLYVCVSYLQHVYPGQSLLSRDLIGQVFHAEPMIWSVMVSNALSILWGVNLLNFQLKVISKGQTTFFQPNGGRTNFTTLQRCRNIVSFLFATKQYVRDPVIVKHL